MHLHDIKVSAIPDRADDLRYNLAGIG